MLKNKVTYGVEKTEMTACGNISFTLNKIYGEEQCKWELAVWSFEPKKPTEE